MKIVTRKKTTTTTTLLLGPNLSLIIFNMFTFRLCIVWCEIWEIFFVFYLRKKHIYLIHSPKILLFQIHEQHNYTKNYVKFNIF